MELEIIDYFNDQTVKNFNKNKNPKLITATNVFAHIEDPNSLINLIKIMTKDTVFVTESHYLYR